MHLSSIAYVSTLATLLPLAVIANPVPDNHKRQTTADRITWYDPSVGITACGGQYSSSDAIVALSSDQFNGGAACGQTISVTANGQTVDATVADLCPGCPSGGLDLSEGLFSELASTDTGVISGTWQFN